MIDHPALKRQVNGGEGVALSERQYRHVVSLAKVRIHNLRRRKIPSNQASAVVMEIVELGELITAAEAEAERLKAEAEEEGESNGN